MEHSSGEATLSDPGVLGDLGLPTEPGDLGTVAVGLLWCWGGIAVCHTRWTDDIILSCETETGHYKMPFF